MESAVVMNQNLNIHWIEEQVTSSNIYEFLDFIIVKYPTYEPELVNIKKKMKKGSRSLLSLVITLRRVIDKKDKKNDELVFLLGKLIQAIMDNPKGFKR